MRDSLLTRGLTRAALALALAAPIAAGCRGLPFEKPPVHLVQNMDKTTRYNPQDKSAFWSDGRAMRPPVEGTVARGELRGDDHLHRGLAAGDWATEMPAAIPLDEALLARGRERYDIFCTPCHGEAGDGKGTVPTRWSKWIVPDFRQERLLGAPVGYFYHVIANGVNTMPSYAAQIPVEDRWAIAAWVRALQLSQVASVNDIPADVRAREGWSK